MAAHIDGLLDPQAAKLAAGVEAADDRGVSVGVGKGPMRARQGVGGSISGFGSKNLGSLQVTGVGVVSVGDP